MSIKAHIALGTLLGVLLGVGAVAALSRGADAAEPADAVAGDRDSDEEDTDASRAPAAQSEAALGRAYRRPMRPGAQRRLLQS